MPLANPSSPHWAGATVKAALERARGQVAGLHGCGTDEVVFTNGGSEANDMALRGAFFALRGPMRRCMHREMRRPGRQ